MSGAAIVGTVAPEQAPAWIAEHASLIADLDDSTDYVVFPVGNALAIEQFSPYSGWTFVRFVEEGEDADAILSGLLFGERL